MRSDPTTQLDSGFSAKYWLFRVAAAVVPVVPMWIVEPLARLAGLAAYVAAPTLRRRARGNLARIPGQEDPHVLEQTCRAAFQHLALNYVDFFRVRTIPDERIAASYTVTKEELFHQALARGKGVIVVCGHLGNWEWAAARIGMFGVPIISPAERLRPERMFDLSCRLRSHHGIRLVPVDRRDSLRELYAALARNEVVFLAIDRDVIGTGVPMRLFGELAPIPPGSALLARRSGATVLWANSWRLGRGQSTGGFEAVEVPAAEGRGAGPASSGGASALERAMRPQLDLLERKVVEHPEQWLAVFTKIWPERASTDHDTSRRVPVGASDNAATEHDSALADRH